MLGIYTPASANMQLLTPLGDSVMKDVCLQTKVY